MQPGEVLHTVNLLQTSPEQFSNDSCQEYILDTITNQAYPVNWYEEGNHKRSGPPAAQQNQVQVQRQGWNNQQQNQPQRQLWQSNQSNQFQGQPRPSHIVVKTGGPIQQFPYKQQQAGQVQHPQSAQHSQQPNQQRPVSCWRCNSPDHFIKVCPQPSKAQTCLKNARVQLDLKNFQQALQDSYTAGSLHERELNIYDRLSSNDLAELAAIELELKQYYQSEKIHPTPVAPKELILVSQHCSNETIPIQQVATQHPDLMSFDEVAANNINNCQDFQPGV